ncbi:hypothetical protein BDV18DRAFT_133924 [Aspergillus unguis]
MGIPMYREPSASGSNKNAVKDACATARSAIRRQPTVRRPSRYGSSSAWRSATMRSPFPRPILDEIEREHGLPRVSYSPPPIPYYAGDPFDLNSSLADNSRREAGRRLLDDVIRQNRPGQRLRLPRNAMASDLNMRSSSAADANARLESREHLPLTPRFAPAVAYHRSSTPSAGTDFLRLSPMPHPDGLEEEAQNGTLIPLLRRVGQRSINDANLTSRGPPIDGLGDRQRSVDLEDDHANDAWETLLTTITPDTNLPSADSSFTSASVPGTNGSHNSASTSATSLDNYSIPGPTSHYHDHSNPCDYPSSSDSDTESEGEITQYSLFRRYRRRMRQVESMRRSAHLNSTMQNPPPIPTISFAFSDRSVDQDLQNLRDHLERGARRDNIPEEDIPGDDFWAAAGLFRSINGRPTASDSSNAPREPDGPVGPR